MATSILTALQSLQAWKVEQHSALDDLEARVNFFSPSNCNESASTNILESSYAPLRSSLRELDTAHKRHDVLIDRLLRSQLLVAVPNGSTVSQLDSIFTAAGPHDRVVVRPGLYRMGTTSLGLRNQGGPLHVLGSTATLQDDAASTRAPVVVDSCSSAPTLLVDFTTHHHHSSSGNAAITQHRSITKASAAAATIEIEDITFRKTASAGHVVLVQVDSQQQQQQQQLDEDGASPLSLVIFRRCRFESEQAVSLSIAVAKGQAQSASSSPLRTATRHQGSHVPPSTCQVVSIVFVDCYFGTAAKSGDIVKLRFPSLNSNDDDSSNNSSTSAVGTWNVSFQNCHFHSAPPSTQQPSSSLRCAVYCNYSAHNQSTSRTDTAVSGHTLQLKNCKMTGRFDHGVLVELDRASLQNNPKHDTNNTRSNSSLYDTPALRLLIDEHLTVHKYRQSIITIETPLLEINSTQKGARLEVDGLIVDPMQFGNERNAKGGPTIVSAANVSLSESRFSFVKEETAENAVSFLFLPVSK